MSEQEIRIVEFYDRISDILICSYCGNDLSFNENCLECDNCGSSYSYTGSGSIDMRLKRHKTYNISFDIGFSLTNFNDIKVEPLILNNDQEVDFSSVEVPFHLTKELVSYFPKAKDSDSLMLDLGCGSTIHKDICQHAGFKWVGLDYESSVAPILGDAHALPFKSNSFEFVLSIAVLEHIQNPFIMMQEVNRVLRPNGIFIGTVAFLEPYHGNSYYHHTHLGAINDLSIGGFIIDKLAPNTEWSVIEAQAEMALFPKMPKNILKLLIVPVKFLHKLWWGFGQLISKNRNRNSPVNSTAGSFMFVARKA